MLDHLSADNSRSPLKLVEVWLNDEKLLVNHNMIALATADATGFPNVRLMLLKSVDRKGLCFFSNGNSDKGQEIEANPRAAFTMFLPSRRRQIRGRGCIESLDADAADEYFSTRPRASQIGAWASAQSRQLDDRAALEERVAKVERQYASRPVPRPPYWIGYRLAPLVIEFWSERPSRLHERLRFYRESIEDGWSETLLYP